MFFKIFLLASLCASLSFTKNINECKSAYDECFDDEHAKYQSIKDGNILGMHRCNMDYRTCYGEAQQDAYNKYGRVPEYFPEFKYRSFKHFMSEDPSIRTSKPREQLSKGIRQCGDDYDKCWESANEIYEETEDDTGVDKCWKEVKQCFNNAYSGYVFKDGSMPATPAYKPLAPIMSRRPKKQPGEVVSDELEAEYKKCDKEWRQCSRASKVNGVIDLEKAKQCEPSYNKCLLAAKNSNDKKPGQHEKPSNGGDGKDGKEDLRKDLKECDDLYNECMDEADESGDKFAKTNCDTLYPMCISEAYKKNNGTNNNGDKNKETRGSEEEEREEEGNDENVPDDAEDQTDDDEDANDEPKHEKKPKKKVKKLMKKCDKQLNKCLNDSGNKQKKVMKCGNEYAMCGYYLRI